MVPASVSLWVEDPPPQASFRLFCFPHAGGGATLFRGWKNHLAPEIAVCAVQLPGRENRLMEPPFIRLSLLIKALVYGLRPFLLPPFAFYGHSMGALISFELARQLRRQNMVSPTRLFLSGQRAPHLPNPNPPIHQLPDSMFIEELSRFNGTPAAILQHEELMQLLLPALRADLALCETYVFSPEYPLSCPFSVFGGLQDHEVSYASLSAWRTQTESSFTLDMLPGDHFFFKKNQTLLLSAISREIMQSLYGD